jgi:hypothetical protein
VAGALSQYYGVRSAHLTRHDQILWTFSIYLESVAIMPQLFLLQKTEVPDDTRFADFQLRRRLTVFLHAANGRAHVALCVLHGHVPRILHLELGVAIHDSGLSQ